MDVSTGLTYPSKAERARRNPKVALLFSDPVGTRLSKPPVVLVQGLAAVRDADLQANTDRYLRLSKKKVPEAYAGMPAFLLTRMTWYFVRIWIQVTPLRILWWPDGDTDRQPECWEAPQDIIVPVSIRLLREKHLARGTKGRPTGSQGRALPSNTWATRLLRWSMSRVSHTQCEFVALA